MPTHSRPHHLHREVWLVPVTLCLLSACVRQTPTDAPDTAQIQADAVVGDGVLACLDTAPDVPPAENAPIACPPFFVAVAVDDTAVCAPDAPVWGIQPPTPTDLVDDGGYMLHSNLTGLTWQKGTNHVPSDFNAAQTYCDSLALGGHTDWRLPTGAELASTGNVALGNAYLDGNQQGSALCWTAVPVVGLRGVWHWSVYVAFGWLYHYAPAVVKAETQCVRSTKDWTQVVGKRWKVDVNAGTVYDHWTQRTWQRDTKINGYKNWNAPKVACASLQLAGGGWRLPTTRELQSLVDRSQVAPAIDIEVFTDVEGSEWRFASAKSPKGNYLEGVDFATGAAFSDVSTVLTHFRCVR